MKRLALGLMIGFAIPSSLCCTDNETDGEPRHEGQPPVGRPESDFIGSACDLAAPVCRQTNPVAYCVDENNNGTGTCRPTCDDGACHGTTQGGRPMVFGDVCVCLP